MTSFIVSRYNGYTDMRLYIVPSYESRTVQSRSCAFNIHGLTKGTQSA